MSALFDQCIPVFRIQNGAILGRPNDKSAKIDTFRAWPVITENDRAENMRKVLALVSAVVDGMKLEV